MRWYNFINNIPLVREFLWNIKINIEEAIVFYFNVSSSLVVI